ncbi:DUF58 domain-containing protein [Candidatus Sumerlaeota bacterium]|nr:DUF58 domain-containing protein [Candidatus Sumerlaeota bacterium]
MYKAMPGENDILLDPEFIKKLQRLQLVTKKVFTGRMKGDRRSKKKGISIEFADYRRYVKGDDIRFVDWNIYSRLETLFLKLFMEEEDLYIYLFVDASRSMEFGNPSKLLFAKRTAAALGYIALSNLDKVGVGAFSSGLYDSLKPMRGKHNTLKLLEFLRQITPQGETRLAESFMRFIRSSPPRGIAVLISDFFDPDGFEDAINLFVQRNYEIYIIHVLSEEELNPNFVGHLELVDSELDRKTYVSVTRDLIKKYQDNLNRFCTSLRQFCIKRNISYIRMRNTANVEDLVLNYLKYRGLIK